MDKKICKAYENLGFLHSHEARPIRVLCELIEPGKKLQDQKVENTIVFFGSARSKSAKQAERTLSDLKAEYPEESKQTRPASTLNRCTGWVARTRGLQNCLRYSLLG